MPSPITAEDFDNQSQTGSVCDLFTAKLLNNSKIKTLLEYLFDVDGNITVDFASDLVDLLEPIGLYKLSPVDLSLDVDVWLKCEGQAVSRTTYAKLFAKLGTTFGPGDGSTTFNLPDFRDRFVIGSSGTKAPATTGGAASVSLDLDHQHIFGDHYNANDDGRFLKGSTANLRAGSTGYWEIHGNTGAPQENNMTSGNAITDLPSEDLSAVSVATVPPYLAVVVYIKANHKIGSNVIP